MSELGIFIDESGNFEKDKSSNNHLRDLYIVSFLFHIYLKLVLLMIALSLPFV